MTKNSLYPALILGALLLMMPWRIRANETDHPVILSNDVLPTASQNPLTDVRIFDPEFYRKFNPELGLTTDAEAIKHWTRAGANHCLRAAFTFSAPDYMARYPDLGLSAALPGACDRAIRHFVTYGFNQGRIGAFDAYPIVFDFNYYVDPANNPDLNNAYARGAWDTVDLEIHWLQHGIGERRGASPFFHVLDYQMRYSDVAGLSPARALYQYVTRGQAERRFGRSQWADPSEWNALLAKSQESVVTAAPNDLVRRFQGANGKQTTVTVKSPEWFTSPSAALPPSVKVCNVPPPDGNNDWSTLTKYLAPSGVKAGCDVVRLAPNSAYHLVLPQNQPPSQDYVLNHWPYLQINNAHDFVFDGNGSTLYFTGPTLGIDISNSQRVVIENLSIDWGGSLDAHPLWRGPLFAAIGTIIADGANSAHIVLDADTPIPPGFVPYIYGFNLWDRQKNAIAADDYLNTGPGDKGCDYSCIASSGKQNPAQQSMSIQGGSLYPNSNPTGQWSGSQLRAYPNRAVMVRFQQFAGDAIQDDYGSNDIRIIRTSIHASPFIGITAGQRGRGLALEDVTETRSQDRPITTIADGAHFAGMGGDIIVEGGEFTGQCDDVMNITESWDILTAVHSANSFVMSGADAIPTVGDTLAFFDAAMGFLGSATIASISPSNLPPWDGQPITVTLDSSAHWLQPGIHAVNLMHVPSRVYVSNVKIHDKLGRGILLGSFHTLVQGATFRDITGPAIESGPSSFFSESVGAADIAIRGNTFARTNIVPKGYQTSADNTSTYPARNASISMFEDINSNYNGASNEVTGIYPTFQGLEISHNVFDSVTGAGIYLTGVRNVRIEDNRFVGCAAVADADPLYSYYGAKSLSALVLSFADNVAARGNVTTSHPSCLARADSSSIRNVVVGRVEGDEAGDHAPR
jgi:hypothetical protein